MAEYDDNRKNLPDHEERMQFNKKNLILIQLGIPQRKILRERLHISLIVQSIKITTESRKVGKQFFALQTDLLFLSGDLPADERYRYVGNPREERFRGTDCPAYRLRTFFLP